MTYPGTPLSHAGVAQQGQHRRALVDEQTDVAFWFGEHEGPFQGREGTVRSPCASRASARSTRISSTLPRRAFASASSSNRSSRCRTSWRKGAAGSSRPWAMRTRTRAKYSHLAGIAAGPHQSLDSPLASAQRMAAARLPCASSSCARVAATWLPDVEGSDAAWPGAPKRPGLRVLHGFRHAACSRRARAV